MKIMVEALINLYQGYLIIYFFRNYFEGDKNTWADVICTLVAGGFLMAHEFCGWKVSDTLVFLIGFVYMTFTHRGNMIWRIAGCIMLAATWTISMAIVNRGVSFLWNVDPSTIKSFDFSGRLLYLVSCNAFLTLITFFISKIVQQKVQVGMTKSASLLFMLLLFSEWVTAELAFVFLSKNAGDSTGSVLFCVFLLAIILITLFLYDYLCRTIAHSFETESNARMIVEAQQHQGDLRILYQSLLKSQHDLKHKIASVEAAIESGDDHDSHHFYKILNEAITADVFLTGNEMVDAVLSAKKAAMDKAGIEFRYQAYPLQNLPVDTVTFCVLISNLLDNAIQECEKLDLEMRRKQPIDFGFSRSMDMFMITCSNPTEKENVDLSPPRLARMKLYGHGYGIESVRRTVEQHHGRCTFSSEAYRFKALLILPMEEN